MMRPLLALAVFLLDAWALARLFAARAGKGRTFGWTAAILLLPFLGAILSLRRGPATQPTDQGPV